MLKANLGALGTRVPTLYKQYTELCEPGGARFLAFGVDPDFSDAVDGLIEVDLKRPGRIDVKVPIFPLSATIACQIGSLTIRAEIGR